MTICLFSMMIVMKLSDLGLMLLTGWRFSSKGTMGNIHVNHRGWLDCYFQFVVLHVGSMPCVLRG